MPHTLVAEVPLRHVLTLMSTLARADEVDVPATEVPAPRVEDALTGYRAQVYGVRTEVHDGAAGWTGPNTAWGGLVRIEDPAPTFRTWGLYAGDARIDAPSVLELTGERDAAADLRHRITMKRWLGRTYYASALVGLGVGLGGIAIASSTTDPEQKASATATASTGLLIAVIGGVGGGIPLSNARRLRHDYSASGLDIATVEALATDENAALRSDLGLTAEQTREIDAALPVSVEVSW